MIELEIIEIDNYRYTLKDENEIIRIIEMEFLDIEKKPQIGEYIYINEQLLNPLYEGYSTSYTFGNLENSYGKENILIDDVDVIKLLLREKEVLLKRLYG